MDYISRRARLIPRDRAPLAQLLRGHCYAVDETVPCGFRDGSRNTCYCAVLFTVSGSSDYVVDGKSVKITPGSLLILPPGISFSERTPEACHNRYLMLVGPLGREIAKVIPKGRPFAFWPKCPPDVASALGRCVELAHRKPEVPPWKLGAELCRLTENAISLNPDRETVSPLAERAREIVLADPSKSWRVGVLARSLAMSESAFAHQFRDENGRTPAAFVRGLRCMIGRSMLETGLTVAETSERLGFRNPYHFSRVFKSETGASPSTHIPDHRRLHRVFGRSADGSHPLG